MRNEQATQIEQRNGRDYHYNHHGEFQSARETTHMPYERKVSATQSGCGSCGRPTEQEP